MAVRDIYPGEELTDDYGYLNVTRPFECLPEPGTTRTMVMPDDALHYYAQWDEQLKDAFKTFNKVAQPFADFIDPQYKDKVMAVVAGDAEMDSTINLYYPGNRSVFRAKNI